MLDVRALTKWYGGLRAVTDVSFSLRAGEILGYVGPNGSGKTTTVNMVTGLVVPTGGEVRFAGGPSTRTSWGTVATSGACRKSPISTRT